MNATSNTARGRTLFFAMLGFFFVSGACGLLYQIVWTRKLVLLFGTTSYAVSTVLSIFFLGLAFGSLWGGRLADRNPRPLRLYGIFEIIIGVWALLFILLIGQGESLVVSILKLVGPSYALGIALRAVFAVVFLLVPVTLMGATLPLVSRFVTAYNPVQGLRIGALYSLNTFGAVAGCMVTGFVLLAELGYTRTTLVGAALNVAVGIVAIVLSRKWESDSVDTEPEAANLGDTGVAVSPQVATLVVAAFAFSGFCSLALEVLWTRLLTVLFLGTTYAFTTMLTTVLCGIAIGSAVASLMIDRVRDRVTAYGFIQALTGATSILMLMVFPHLPDLLNSFQASTGMDWERMVIRKFFLSFAVLFIPTFLFGMSFPFAVRIIAGSPLELGRSIGRVYSANTFGGVIGSLAGGFVIIPMLGTQNGIILLSVVLAASGVMLLLANSSPDSTRRRLVLTAASVVLVVGGIALAPKDVSLAMNEWFMPEEQELIDYREGVEGTVMVTGPADSQEGTDRVLWINAVQATASIEKGVKMNRFQGALPFFFNRPMDEALFMCFGSGVTAGTLSLSPFERIDTVEISENVLEMAEHFKTDNFDVLNSPRVNPIVDDGRNFLLTTDNRYDLITFEPMPLALTGVSTFYTREYYELCLAHLKEDGIVSQWIPLHNGLHLDVVQSLVKTFTDVFPEVSGWFINADLFLIGSTTPQSVDYAALEEHLQEADALREGLESVHLVDMPELLCTYFGSKAQLEAFAGDAEVMRDDQPWAEFLAPKMIYSGNVRDILEALEPYRGSPLDIVTAGSTDNWEATRARLEHRYRAHMQDFRALQKYYGGLLMAEPDKAFAESLEIDPDDANAKYYYVQIVLAKAPVFIKWDDRREETVEMLENARRYAPTRPDVLSLLGEAYLAVGDEAKAREAFAEHIRLGGSDSVALEHVGAPGDTP